MLSGHTYWLNMHMGQRLATVQSEGDDHYWVRYLDAEQTGRPAKLFKSYIIDYTEQLELF